MTRLSRSEVEAVVADIAYWAAVGVFVLCVEPAAEAGVRVGVTRLDGWVRRALRSRYEFPVECWASG
ncbi:hypothetical protein ACVGVM_16315 [Pseudonocardia bannensis]|uniref:Uncharacterized protein n=1 Tax=Pseudonocardia bannensis TaxID=630973 RepID=A0A848DL41_9PSEU|nr:hypothetical protein [Pseudonocardia bannensis]NMH93263.1 hypothetical protein [Pseudonocardia bannensis]